MAVELRAILWGSRVRWARKVILRIFTYERTKERLPILLARPPRDIFSLGENEVRKVAEQIRARKQKWDLVAAGTECRDFSSVRMNPPRDERGQGAV